MNNKDFSKVLEKRTKKVAIDLLKYTAGLPECLENQVLRHQLAKSGTSIGANYREANRARSKADFLNKISICEAEASETQYWLEVIAGVGWKSWDELQADYDECSELLAIVT